MKTILCLMFVSIVLVVPGVFGQDFVGKYKEDTAQTKNVSGKALGCTVTKVGDTYHLVLVKGGSPEGIDDLKVADSATKKQLVGNLDADIIAGKGTFLMRLKSDSNPPNGTKLKKGYYLWMVFIPVPLIKVE